MAAIDLPGGDDVSTLSYEQARDALAAVVAALEAGGTSLEQSLALWERGEELAGICQTAGRCPGAPRCGRRPTSALTTSVRSPARFGSAMTRTFASARLVRGR